MLKEDCSNYSANSSRKRKLSDFTLVSGLLESTVRAPLSKLQLREPAQRNVEAHEEIDGSVVDLSNCKDELNFYDIYPRSTCESDDSGRHRLSSNINNPCPNCFALHFIEEKAPSSNKLGPEFSRCCVKGAITSELMKVETPNMLLSLLRDDTRRG